MFITGTSGHIDHGKTSLVRALTGIDCDRLPEEKERAMTIDIGFAKIDFPGFGTAGIVDVPGHEKFIRNMVAGAWGVDLCMLVVACDDGWMPQTEDHFRVLAILGIERIIIVLNKSDLVSDERIKIVMDDINGRLSGTVYSGSEIIPVSAKTGKGIDLLKAIILRDLESLAAASDSGKPYLFIDRVFASKGHGTVVTGTLKNGFLYPDQEVVVLPSGKKARIKRIESHNSASEKGYPSGRTAVNLSGFSVDELRRGDILCVKNFFTECTEFLAEIVLFPGVSVKNNHGIEVLAGTSDLRARIIFLIAGADSTGTFIARVRLDSPWFFYPGERFVITGTGGNRVSGGGTVLMPGFDSSRDRASALENASIIHNKEKDFIIKYILAVRKIFKRDDLQEIFPMCNDYIEERLLSMKDLFPEINGYIFDKRYLSSLVSSISEILEKSIDLNLKEISDSLKLGVEECRALLDHLVKSGSFTEREGRYSVPRFLSDGTLSEKKKTILEEARNRKGSGIELDTEKNEIKKREMKELLKMKLLVSLDGNILYHHEIYDDFKNKIVALFDSADKITVTDAKEATGLSRKFIIPLLNRIESDGKIRRIGDFRIKV